MSLKYYEASLCTRCKKPKDSYYSDYEAMFDFGFDNAPNIAYNEIEYEATYGENDFVKIDRVRVDTVLEYNTGIILGDDYKTFIFAPEFQIQPYYGMKFKWKDNYWLVINTNVYESMANSAEVRRCNNVLRYFDEKGEKLYEPCIIDYTLRFANNEDTMAITVGNGEQKVWCQRNKKTVKILPNQRFLFGTPEQRVAFRLYGGGTKNYLNSKTFDDNSPTITEFYLDHYEINPSLDDIENGFANAYLNEVKIEITNSFDNIKVGDNIILEAKVYKGLDEIYGNNIIWTSYNTDVATIENGVLVVKAEGTAKIEATIDGTKISSSKTINSSAGETEDLYELLLEPNEDFILQGREKSFSVNLFKNGIKQFDTVNFINITNSSITNNYDIVVKEDNSFIVYNKKMSLLEPVKIKCVCGEKVKIVSIYLRGLY